MSTLIRLVVAVLLFPVRMFGVVLRSIAFVFRLGRGPRWGRRPRRWLRAARMLRAG